MAAAGWGDRDVWSCWESLSLPSSIDLRGRDWAVEHGCYILRPPPLGGPSVATPAAAAPPGGGVPAAAAAAAGVAPAAAAAPRVGVVGAPPPGGAAGTAWLGADPLGAAAASAAATAAVPPADVPRVPAKAVLHFIGGAFVGAIPHTAYRTLLTRLAARGYIILATPYSLSFNYLSTLSSLLTPYGRATTSLALDYGPLPVIGVGHSAGALLHLLAGALFGDDSDKAANILISWNNKSAADAVPLPGLSSLIPAAAAAAVDAVPAEAESALTSLVELVDGLLLGEDPLPVVPPAVREELLRPFVADSRRVAAQVPALVRELASMAAGGGGVAAGATPQGGTSWTPAPAPAAGPAVPLAGPPAAAPTAAAVEMPPYAVARAQAATAAAPAAAVGTTAGAPSAAAPSAAGPAVGGYAAVGGAPPRPPPPPPPGGAGVGGGGGVEFHPTPAATASAVTALYDVPATLVVRFASDSIDESPRLVQLLASC